MDNYDLIGALRTAASENNWPFLYGDDFYKNYEASKKDFAIDQLILGADPFIARPEIINSQVPEIRYTGLIMLGRKFEATTAVTLDETTIQKYDRRLLDLTTLLSNFIGSFACDNDLEVSDPQFDLKLNHLDENVDFIVANLTFIQ